jgi:acetyl esterase/lipase
MAASTRTERRTTFVFAICLFIVFFVSDECRAQETFALWPGSLGPTEKDNPTLTMYPPDSGKASGTAIIICPGGSYRGLARHEGEDYALFLASYGIRAFVLKYRLGPVYHHAEITADAARAIRMVRQGASRWGIDPQKIGIMGSSAGGHLASTMMTHFDQGNPDSPDPIERLSSRPDFGILCYPVISMGPIGHAISREQFLGPNPGEALITRYSNELQVSHDTPPGFLWHTSEDSVVSVDNSLLFAKALKQHGVPFALHVYEHGRHGLGIGAKFPFDNPHPWIGDLLVWLSARALIR